MSLLNEYSKPFVVAEIGACHLGSFERAKKLCLLAKEAGCDYVKLQKRNPKESTPIHMQDEPHPNQYFAYGETYLKHRENLELDALTHHKISRYCSDIGIGYSCSVWDLTSAKNIIEINPDFIKIPSAHNHNWNMLNYIKDNYKGDIHVSTGMTTKKEREELIQWCMDLQDRIVFYHSTSSYPCPFEDLYLLEIQALKNIFKDTKIRVGFSNHGKGIAADIAAYMLGAQWIERHFIDDRTTRHTDAAASLEPGGMQKLVRDLEAISSALTHRPESDMSEEESKQRYKMRFNGENYGD